MKTDRLLGCEYDGGHQDRVWLLTLPCIVAVLAIYARAIGHAYVWDDIALFLDDSSLRYGPLEWSIIARPVLDGTSYFRPVVFLSFFLEFHLWGVNSAVSHTVNLILHAANSVLVTLIALTLFERLKLARPGTRAAIAGIIYAVHPSLVEPVAWVSGRFDLMMTLFCLAALLLDSVLVNKYVRPVVLAILFFCGLASKEAAVVLPLLLVLHRVIVLPRGESLVAGTWRVIKLERLSVLSCALAFVAYMILRVDAMGRTIHALSIPPEGVNPVAAGILLPLNTLWFYLIEIALPFARVNVFHPLDWNEITSAIGYAKALGAISVLCVIAYLSRNRKSVTAFFAAGFIVCLLPVLNILPLTIGGNIGHDRFLTLPSMYWALVLAGLGPLAMSLVRPRLASALTFSAGGVWALMAAALSMVTVPIWANQSALWSWAYHRDPENGDAQTAYVSMLIDSRRFDMAVRILERHRGSVGSGFDIWEQIHYGYALVQEGRVDEGRNYLMGALPANYERWDAPQASDPSTARGADSDGTLAMEAMLYIGLAHAAVLSSQLHEAQIWTDRAVAANPDSYSSTTARAFVLLLSGDPRGIQEMRQVFDHALPSQRTALLAEIRAQARTVCGAGYAERDSVFCQRNGEVKKLINSLQALEN